MSETTLREAAVSLSRTPALESARSGTALLLGVTLATFAIHLFGIHHYGFFRDELYYIACGEHLSWGYIDQPPLIAFIAWFARHVFGNSLFAFRLLPVLAHCATVLLAGVFTRKIGGGRLAQFLAAMSVLFAPLFLAFGSFLSMNAFEPVFWLVSACIVVRIVKGATPKWWLVFGAVAGIGILNKHTMILFGFAIVAGLILSGEGRLLRSKWIWFGGLVALALFLPNLIWESRNGWPQFEVVRHAQEFKNQPVSPVQFLFEQILFLQPLAFPVWLAGLSWYFFAPEGKRYRLFGWAYLIVMGVFIVFGGKSYYPLPFYPILLAAGGIAFEKFASAPGRRWLAVAYPALLIVAGFITVPFGVPVLPVETFLRYAEMIPLARPVKTERDATAELPQFYADMFGWENTAGTIARVYHALPAAEQADCAIVAGNYGEAGAIDYYGPRLGLSKAISGHNNYFLWGPRNYSGGCVILFGDRSEELKELFGEVEQVATISNPLGMPVEQNLAVYLCRKPRAPLAELWPNFKLII